MSLLLVYLPLFVVPKQLCVITDSPTQNPGHQLHGRAQISCLAVVTGGTKCGKMQMYEMKTQQRGDLCTECIRCKFRPVTGESRARFSHQKREVSSVISQTIFLKFTESFCFSQNISGNLPFIHDGRKDSINFFYLVIISHTLISPPISAKTHLLTGEVYF